MPASSDVRMQKLKALLASLENKIPYYETISPMVSDASVGWHLHHSLLVIQQVSNAVLSSDPSTYRWKFSAMKTLIYSLNRIPRGKVKAPRSVRPEGVIDKEALGSEVRAAYQNIDAIRAAHPDAYFRHPFFGNLNQKPTLKFLVIHTKHHLKIVDDIIRGSAV